MLSIVLNIFSIYLVYRFLPGNGSKCKYLCIFLRMKQWYCEDILTKVYNKVGRFYLPQDQNSLDIKKIGDLLTKNYLYSLSCFLNHFYVVN